MRGVMPKFRCCILNGMATIENIHTYKRTEKEKKEITFRKLFAKENKIVDIILTLLLVCIDSCLHLVIDFPQFPFQLTKKS